MDKEKVKNALLIVENALTDEDFVKWLEENEGDLTVDYDGYATSCYETFEEPDDFYIWALWQYVNLKQNDNNEDERSSK